MTSNSMSLSEILMIVFYVILLSILVVGVWRFFKTQRK
jgi:FtsZ-interacting cell division protein ZipA